MSGKSLLSVVSLVEEILVVLIGIAHTAATPMVYRGAVGMVHDKAAGLAYFFAVMGLYIVLCGWLMVYASRALRRGERWAWIVSVGNGAFNRLAGVGAVAVGFRSPLVWTWLLVAVALFTLALPSASSFRHPAAVAAPAASS